uniref:N-6 DNA methylase n=1 Tax=Pantoea ananas TaxID=553 RepID=UPI00036C08DF
QLDFADFFNQAEDPAPAPVAVPVAAAACEPSPAHRMMSIETARKQFVSVFRHTARHLRRWDVFSDFITLAASELDFATIRAPESMARCRKICGRYRPEDIQDLHRLFGLMVSALEAKFHDFLGAIFMELELGDGRQGQYFTPYSVQSLMARMLMPGAEDAVRREGFFTLSEPTCGAGGMVVAVAECMLEAGLNPSEQMFASCIDIDPVAADMAFIQLSLLGIPAEVITGNTLTLKLSRVRYTPIYYANDFGERLKTQRRINAMMDFMRSLSDGQVNAGP